MKCTNKIRILLGMVLSISFILAGCGRQDIPMEYSVDMPVSSFSINGTKDAEAADSFASGLCVTAKDVTQGTDVDMDGVSAAGLFDITRTKVLYAKNIHEKLYPASLTKVMTALVALKHGDLDDMITVTANAHITESGAVLCGLEEGDTLTIDQALHALLIHSANDAGVAIAEHIGGSIEGFAEMMNHEAMVIGATNSHFVNPHGLSDDNHYVTAYDMYLIFNAALKADKKFAELIQTTTYDTVYHDAAGAEKKLSFTNSNQYLKGTYSSPDNVTVIGGKTGTTNAAGNCLILYSKDTSGNEYISVILRSKGRENLYTEMTDLLGEIK